MGTSTAKELEFSRAKSNNERRRRQQEERVPARFQSVPTYLGLLLENHCDRGGWTITQAAAASTERHQAAPPNSADEASVSQLRHSSSVLFDMDPESAGQLTPFSHSAVQGNGASNQGCFYKASLLQASPPATSSALCGVPSLTSGPVDRLLSLCLPYNDLSHLLVQQLRRLRPSARGTTTQSVEDLATDLLSLGYLIQARDGSSSSNSSNKQRQQQLQPDAAGPQGHTRNANPLRSLRHRFLVCTGWHQASGNREVVLLEEPLIVEPRFKEQFLIANPTREYEELLQAVPISFVGNLGRLQAAVHILGAEIAEAFRQQCRALPPWRTPEALLSKWAPSQMEDLAKLMRHAASMPPTVTPHYERAPTPHMGVAASSAHLPATPSTPAFQHASAAHGASGCSEGVFSPCQVAEVPAGGLHGGLLDNCKGCGGSNGSLPAQQQEQAGLVLAEARQRGFASLLPEEQELQVLPLLPHEVCRVFEQNLLQQDPVAGECAARPSSSTAEGEDKGEGGGPACSSSSSSSSDTPSSQFLSKLNDLGTIYSGENAGNACSSSSHPDPVPRGTSAASGGRGAGQGRTPPPGGLNLAKGLGLLRSHSSSLNLHNISSQQQDSNAAMFRLCQQQQRSLQCVPTSRAALPLWQAQELSPSTQAPCILSMMRSQDLDQCVERQQDHACAQDANKPSQLSTLDSKAASTRASHQAGAPRAADKGPGLEESCRQQQQQQQWRPPQLQLHKHMPQQGPLSPLKFQRVSSKDLRQQVQQSRGQTRSALATALRTQADGSPHSSWLTSSSPPSRTSSYGCLAEHLQQQLQQGGEQLHMKTMRPLQELLHVHTVKWGAAQPPSTHTPRGQQA